jgi:DNA-binding SARP family transcriptional activator
MADGPEAAPDTPLQVSLLGTIEANVTSGWAPIAGMKQRSLLALLALSTPRPVSDLVLIEELWGDDQPAKPSNALQAQVSQLRRTLGSHMVRRHGLGYALCVQPDHVDALRLERLVSAGVQSARHGAHLKAAALFRAGLALVRGPPLFELLDLPFGQAANARLEQVTIAAHEGLVDAEIAAGHHTDVVDMLGELVSAHPFRERFHEQLMIALFRCGRQTEALRAYQNVRTLLGTELGLEPGPQLRALERAVLSHDPSLLAPVPLTAPRYVLVASAPATSFIGRTAELAAVEHAMVGSRVVTLVGPAGAGKTRLAWQFTTGCLPMREWWFVELAHVTDGSAVPETVAATIGAADHSPAGGTDQRRSAEERIVERLGNRSVVIVLDNCEHLVDRTASLVNEVLPRCPAVTILATSRQALGLEGERQIVISSMTDDDAAALFHERSRDVQASVRPAGDRDVVDLCRHLDGLPLAIELAAARTRSLPIPEIAARLQDRFELLTHGNRPGASGRNGLREAIDWSYDSLLVAEQRTFRTFAVFAGGATAAAVRTVCGPSAIDTVDQ